MKFKMINWFQKIH